MNNQIRQLQYPVATLHGYGDNADACREIVSFYDEDPSGAQPLEFRADATTAAGFSARPTVWVCSPKRTWLEVVLGKYP